MEDRLTPRQLDRLLPRLGELSGHPLEACQRSYILRELRSQRPQGYVRNDIAEDVVFFRGEGEPAAKSLIVTLCGRSHRPNMSWSLFLQHLPSQLFDVAILCDRRNNHFYDGIEGYAADLLSLQRRLSADLGISAYRRVYFYGTSSGGLAAIRMGLISGARRSIAVGGLFAWPMFRLQNGEDFQAFDPICACNSGQRDRVICVHASNDRDTLAARQVERAIGATRVRVPMTDDHNVSHQIYLKGGLMDFHARLFEFKPRLAAQNRRSPSRAE